MKRFFSAFIGLAIALSAFAQTAEEICNKMDEVLNTLPQDRMAMTVDIKIPVLGTTTTRTYCYDNKIRMDAKMMGVTVTTFDEDNVSYTVATKEGKTKITIEDVKAGSDSSAEEGDMEMFSGITDDYSVSIRKETADTWYIQCKKLKTCKDKDAPGTMDIVVAKADYMPLSLSAKMSGARLTMRDFSFDVDEKMCTFNMADYPGATVEDKRGKSK